MNQVARVFVVINILLSAAFLMAAATFLHQSTNWKQIAADTETAKMDSEKALNHQIAQLDTDIKNLQDDLNSRKAKVNSLNSDLSAAKTEASNALEQKNQTERKFTLLQETHNQAVSKLAALTDSVGGLEARIETYRAAREAAQDKERDALAEQARIAAVRETLKKAKAALENNVKDLQGRLNSTMTELLAYRGAYPPPNNKSQPVVNGQVIRFDAGTNMVQVNKGANDGVRLGHRFDIVHGSDFVCTVMIDYIDGSTSVGHIAVPSTTGASPISGDKATKLSGM